MSLDIYVEDPITEAYIDLSHIPLLTDLNVTHNLNKLAQKLGIYEVLWHPEDHPVLQKKSPLLFSDVLPYLYEAYYLVSTKGECYPEVLPTNGWGTPDSLLRFVIDYITVAKEYPNAHVIVST